MSGVARLFTESIGDDDILDPLCAKRRADVNCSGSTDVLDVVLATDVAFRGSDPSAKFCDPCQ